MGKTAVKNTNTWMLNNTLLDNQEIIEEIKEETKIPGNKWQWKQDNPKQMGCSKSSSKREFYSNKILPQETRIISNKQPKPTPKQLEKEEQKTPKLADGKKS